MGKLHMLRYCRLYRVLAKWTYFIRYISKQKNVSCVAVFVNSDIQHGLFNQLCRHCEQGSITLSRGYYISSCQGQMRCKFVTNQLLVGCLKRRDDDTYEVPYHSSPLLLVYQPPAHLGILCGTERSVVRTTYISLRGSLRCFAAECRMRKWVVARMKRETITCFCRSSNTTRRSGW